MRAYVCRTGPFFQAIRRKEKRALGMFCAHVPYGFIVAYASYIVTMSIRLINYIILLCY